MAVLALVAAAIVAAVGIARVVPAMPAIPQRTATAVSAAPGSQVAVVPTIDASPVPDASSIIAGTPPRLSREDFVAAIRDGSLDGRLVFVDGVMRATAAPCPSLAGRARGCVDLEIPGIGVPVWQGGTATPWPGNPPPGSWIVAVARTDGLVYLGSLRPSQAGPLPITELASGALPGHRGTLFEARGFLVANPADACDTRGAAATPCPASSAFLANDQPQPTGVLASDAGEVVATAPSIPEVDPTAVVTGGTFLVTRLPGHRRALARACALRAGPRGARPRPLSEQDATAQPRGASPSPMLAMCRASR